MPSLYRLIQSPRVFRHAMNLFWLPWRASGIHVSHLSDDWRSARTELRSTFYNRNYVGVHFGGSLYSMCDPMYMLLLMNCLRSDFVVWDKAASIEYRKPGRGIVVADFVLSDELLERLMALQPGEKSIFDLPVQVVDEEDEVVAAVSKTLYVKRKEKKETAQ